MARPMKQNTAPTARAAATCVGAVGAVLDWVAFCCTKSCLQDRNIQHWQSIQTGARWRELARFVASILLLLFRRSLYFKLFLCRRIRPKLPRPRSKGARGSAGEKSDGQKSEMSHARIGRGRRRVRSPNPVTNRKWKPINIFERASNRARRGRPPQDRGFHLVTNSSSVRRRGSSLGPRLFPTRQVSSRANTRPPPKHF